MALKISDQYANTTPPSADYPQGSFKNETTPGALNGTPLEKAWLDDIQGLLQALLVASGTTPTGSADTVQAPQYLASIFNLRYYERVDYKVGTTVTGSDGNKYVCAVANGPATVIVDPVTENPRTYWLTERAARFAEDNPVGTIRITESSSHGFPAGTWVQTLSGRVPVGVNTADSDFNAVNKTGGSKTHTHGAGTLSGGSHSHAKGTLSVDGHTLTVDEIPAHTHTSLFPYQGNNKASEGQALASQKEINQGDTDGTDTRTSQSTGGGDPHTHGLSGATASASVSVTGSTASASTLQPYQTVYFWKRTA